MVAVNGSVEVDLYGQICSESYGHRMRSGTGGQLDFVVGSFWSPGGRAINLVPSTAMKGTRSRIVPDSQHGRPRDRTPALYRLRRNGIRRRRSLRQGLNRKGPRRSSKSPTRSSATNSRKRPGSWGSSRKRSSNMDFHRGTRENGCPISQERPINVA